MPEVKERTRNIKISNDEVVEAGDLANVIGKYCLEDLEIAVEDHRKYGIDKLYFICQLRKDPRDTNKLKMTIGVTDIKLRLLKESTDFWEYDYLKEKLTLLWSIPHRIEMKNFLKSPEKYSKDLIRWINEYIKQEKINLKDESAQVISS